MKHVKKIMETERSGDRFTQGMAHEIWAAAQLMPGEGIEDGVERILSILLKWQEENKMNGKGVKSDPYSYVFVQGYACAVATLIRLNGCVTTNAKELFRAGLRMDMIDSYGLDQNDIDLFKKHRGPEDKNR